MTDEKYLKKSIQKIFKKFDTDKNGKLDYIECENFVEHVFYSFPLKKWNHHKKWTVLKKIMKDDKDRNKNLDKKEIRGLIKRLCKLKIKTIKKDLDLYLKQKEAEEKRLEDLRIQHYLEGNVMPLLL